MKYEKLIKTLDRWLSDFDKDVINRSNDDGEEFYFIALAGLIIGTAEGATRVEALRNLREKVS